MKRPDRGDPDYSTRIWEYIAYKNSQTKRLLIATCAINIVAMLFLVAAKLAG